MTDGVKVTFRRKDKLLRDFRQMAPQAEIELTKAGAKSAGEMVALARSFVPVKTGALRDSIQATPPGHSPPGYAQGAGQVPRGAHAVTAGNSTVRYPHLVEYGTAPHANRGVFEGTDHPGTGANPFFWPAYRVIRKRHQSRASRALSKSVKDAVK